VSDDDRVIRSGLCSAFERLRREERGMTLIEAMVAAMVLMVGLIPTIKVFDSSRDQNATGERHEIALLQAEQALEEMRGLPYDRLLMNAGAGDPGGGRLTPGGVSLRIRSDLTEPLAYYSTEGVPADNAWVRPVTQVTTGSADAPVDLTVYKFVTWRDEECSVADLSGLGVSDMSGAIAGVQSPLTALLSPTGPLNTLIAGLTGSNRTLIDNLKSRLTALQGALTARTTQLTGALSGVSQLDLCDINTSALRSLQGLGSLTPALQALDPKLDSLQSVLGGLCLPVVGCVLSSAANTQVTSVNNQLNCMFGGSSVDTTAEFTAYIDGVTTNLSQLPGDLYDTDKNTKRITVAVVIDPQTGAGPQEPVWATSVVRDPTAGLITDGAPSCT
jgi:hypothetical protein